MIKITIVQGRVMAITAKLTKFGHAGVMQRVVDEAEYVLTVLRRARDEVSANPELYDPDAQTRIDEAITRVEDTLRQARLIVWSPGQELKAA